MYHSLLVIWGSFFSRNQKYVLCREVMEASLRVVTIWGEPFPIVFEDLRAAKRVTKDRWKKDEFPPPFRAI
jgi:hypothetical protein